MKRSQELSTSRISYTQVGWSINICQTKESFTLKMKQFIFLLGRTAFLVFLYPLRIASHFAVPLIHDPAGTFLSELPFAISLRTQILADVESP